MLVSLLFKTSRPLLRTVAKKLAINKRLTALMKNCRQINTQILFISFVRISTSLSSKYVLLYQKSSLENILNRFSIFIKAINLKEYEWMDIIYVSWPTCLLPWRLDQSTVAVIIIALLLWCFSQPLSFYNDDNPFWKFRENF